MTEENLFKTKYIKSKGIFGKNDYISDSVKYFCRYCDWQYRKWSVNVLNEDNNLKNHLKFHILEKKLRELK